MTRTSIILKVIGMILFIGVCAAAPNIVGRIEPAKRPMILPQEHETPWHSTAEKIAKDPITTGSTSSDDIDTRIQQQVLNNRSKIDHLPNRNMTANVGQYQTIEAAQKDLPKLREYLKGCSFDFCQIAEEHISLMKTDWPGGITYHLVIENIDDPTLYALCNYMWNNSVMRWAREPYHMCSEFNREDN